jgi:calcium-dependent protein kinase
MSDFVSGNKLKQSVMQFISLQFNLKEEENDLRKVFEEFDLEKTGILSIKAFTVVLTKYFGENEAKIYAENIFQNIDMNRNGEISYNEFISAILDNKSILTKERLEKAFKMFDKVKKYSKFF